MSFAWYNHKIDFLYSWFSYFNNIIMESVRFDLDTTFFIKIIKNQSYDKYLFWFNNSLFIIKKEKIQSIKLFLFLIKCFFCILYLIFLLYL